MRKSFTMVELIIVMVIIGFIAGFAIPGFMKTINRSRARNAILNLNVIHASNVLYRVREGVNIGSVANTGNTLAEINATLGLSMLLNGATYVCNGTTCVATGTGFTATATLATALANNNVNPVCVGVSCP